MVKLPGNSARYWSRKMALVVLVLLIVISNGCSLPIPGPWQPTEIAIPTGLPQPTLLATAQPTPTLQMTPAEALPPALVETNPLPLTEIGPKTAFTFYFNQPMERGSVQEALQANPAVAGSFQWMDDATVKFIPDKPLPVNTHLAVSFSTRARATNGLALSAPVDIAFQTAAGFKLVDQLPKPGTTDIDPTSAVVATFTRPMVPLGADSKDLPEAFALEPAANGRGEWINTSTYIFYPDPALMGGLEYTVRMNDAISAVDGSGWADGQKPASWKFSTAKPKLLTVLPESTVEINLDAVFVFTFNQPMDSASSQQNLSMIGPDGVQVKGKFSWNDAGSELTFQPDDLLVRNAEYQVKLSGSTQARGGAALGTDYSFTYRTVPDFGVQFSEPSNEGTLAMYDVFGGVRIQFTAPLGKQDLTDKFLFSPAIGDPFVSNFSEKEVYISGIFAYNTAYTLTLQAGIHDKWGQNLKEPVVINFRTQAPQPSLTFSTLLGGGMAFLTPGETAFSGQATNIKTLRIGSAALSVDEYAHLASIYSFERSQKYDGPGLSTYEIQKNLPMDKNVPVDIPLTAVGTTRAPGLYYYQVDSPELALKTGQSLPSVLLVVSRIHLVLKQSQNQLTLWAVNLETNQPLPGAQLAIMVASQTGELTQIGTLMTDQKGLAQLDYAFESDSYDRIYAVLGKPGDPDFSLSMTSWTEGVNAWDLGIPYAPQDQFTHTYIYTDRPIYQPGQQVDFRILMHAENNGRYSSANIKEINVKVLGEYSLVNGDRTTLFQATLPLSEYGSASDSFSIPDSAAPGYYSIEVNEDPNANLSFQIANYRKPEIELQTTFASPELKAGQDIEADVQAKYYFGAPAANLNLQWVLYASTRPFLLPQGYQAGPLETGWLLPRGLGIEDSGGLGKFIIQGQLKTGADGRGSIHVPAQQLLDALDETFTYQLTLEITINDQEELPVSNRAQAMLHPADFYIGVRPDTWSGQAKNEASFTIQTFNWQKTSMGDRKLKASFQKVVFQQKTDWNWQSGTPPYTKEISEVASTDFQVDKDGQARIAFTPPDPGTYQVELTGEGALTQILFWVGGEGRAPWPVMPSQQIRLVTDAASYNPGQTAKIFIPNPLGENTLALITVERGRVMKTDVVAISGSSLTWDLAVSEEDAPNVFVSVLLVESTQGSAPQFRIGYTELSVPPKPLEIQVQLTPQPATAPPGGEVTLELRITDFQGNPVQGEFSLAVVDKAVLALADPNSPAIEEAFYGKQPIGVRTSLALAVYGRPQQRETVQAVGGRGGGGDLSIPDVRSNFQDTAYWNGAVVTDEKGMAAVKVKLPDNLTTWVVTARGLNREVRVGEAAKEVVVSKDLLIRPVTPRFLLAGDRIELAALVNNNTSNTFSADVLLEASGLTLENPDLASQKIDLPAQGRVRVTWWARVQHVEKVDLEFSAEGGGMSDATRPSSGSLPVLNYATPQTFATGGVLTEAGEQLEVISAPRSFNPTGGELRVELSPSLAAAILSGLKALDTFPHDFAEPVASRLLANLETYQALQKLGISAPELKDQLDVVIQESLGRLISWQNKDGGWGWSPEGESDLYLTSYLLFTLSESKKAGLAVDTKVVENAANYLAAGLIVPDIDTKAYRLDQLVFQFYTLHQSGYGRKVPPGVYDVRERLSPWAKALLALTLDAQSENDDPRARNLVSDLQSQALRSATGAHWETLDGLQFNLATPVFTTAVVSLAIARLDPAAAVLTDAVRYISAHRRTNGCWASTYESTWVLMALTDVLGATGELSASFAYTAVLNGMPLASGQAGGPNALTPIESRIPLANLNQDAPNGLKIIHEEGPGRLYYRAFLQVYRPVEEVSPLNRGLTISRKMVLSGQDCTKTDCPAVDRVSLSDQRELQVHLTLTLPQAMYHLVVEDFIPAGAEIVDLSLKTSQKGIVPQPDQAAPQFVASDPFRSGWNWWRFSSPKIYDDHIEWAAAFLPAGTYELTYRLTPLQAGEFRLLPAHAYETYFPEVEGASAGAIFRIDP